MPASPPRFPITLAQMLQRIVAYRFQQVVAGRAVLLARHHQILVGERGKQVQHLDIVDAFPDAHRFRRIQRPATGEHRQSTQYCLLGIAQ